jgi:hypothetical protein
MTQKYRKESFLRRKLHNTLADLKGQIRVFCRVRPLTPKELEESQGDEASSVRTLPFAQPPEPGITWKCCWHQPSHVNLT